MIDDKTIKSLYDDKPTLLEWLKRVEAQLEELKKVANFDTLTANNAEISQKLSVQNILSHKGDFDELNVKGNPLSKAIYIHKLTFNIGGNALEKTYLSTNPNAYASLADVFANSSENTLGHNEVFTHRHGTTYYPILYFFNIGANGVVQKGLSIDYGTLALNSVADSDISSMTISDRVLGGWGA